MLLCLSCATAQSILDPNDVGFSGQSREQNYNTLLDALYSSGRVTTTIGDKLWVPWFSSSSSCTINDLQRGNNCNSGQNIDWTHNCMVTDEFSQVGMMVSMGDDQQRMDQFYNTVTAIDSTFGDIPAWRVYRNGNTIEPCRNGINGNCDTASDATARIIIALYTASKNDDFSNTAQKQRYHQLATTLAQDMLEHEILHTCKASDLGYGDICYWLAAGSQAKRGGMGTTDFAYTGYFGDAIIAMLAACSQTGDQQYCEVAQHLTLNYLQAANFDGQSFSAPPGRSFKWINLNGVPEAQCTHSCSPVQWDYADASRAVGMCQANYYAEQMDVELPGLQEYCEIWGNRYMNDPNRAPIQYYPNGNAVNYQSGYFAQGLQALFESGGHNQDLFEPALDRALAHYVPSTGTWDYTACFGVYMPAFAVRALGFGIGKDLAVFSEVSEPPNDGGVIVTPSDSMSTDPVARPTDRPGDISGDDGNDTDNNGDSLIESLDYSCTYSGSNSCTLVSDTTSGVCRTVISNTPHGAIQIMGCVKDDGFVEVYRQQHPSGVTFRACLDEGCVDQYGGFARFDPDGNDEPNDGDGGNGGGGQSYTIQTLPFSVSPSGTLISDTMDGSSCRRVRYSTASGQIEAKACARSTPGQYEMYLLQSANPASVCVGTNCVGPSTGFVSFTY